MSLSVGIIGLPNAGKSSLFNALVKTYQAKVESYPFTTIDPNIGVVEIPDPTLNQIATTLKLSQKLPATIEFVDIAGLVKDAHQGAGLGNQFLSHIRAVDVVVHVVRGFADPESHEPANPSDDYQIVRTELTLSDQDKNIPSEQHLVSKPELVLLNTEQASLGQALPPSLPSATLVTDVKLEAELPSLTAEEQVQYLKSLGLSESVLPRLIKAAYELLNLITFYTLKPDQVQAWPIPRGTKAPQAAGAVHSDFERGFIAAEVVSSKDLLACGSWQEAKAQGKIRTEGKDYVVTDGDVVNFRFNV